MEPSIGVNGRPLKHTGSVLRRSAGGRHPMMPRPPRQRGGWSPSAGDDGCRHRLDELRLRWSATQPQRKNTLAQAVSREELKALGSAIRPLGRARARSVDGEEERIPKVSAFT